MKYLKYMLVYIYIYANTEFFLLLVPAWTAVIKCNINEILWLPVCDIPY